MYKNNRVVYCIYTNDEIEQLVFQFDKLKELCDKLGLSWNYVQYALYSNNIIVIENQLFKIYRVVLDDE